jgi:hypothetical protein
MLTWQRTRVGSPTGSIPELVAKVMTAQFAEVLHYKGRKRSMCSLPLSLYFELAGEPPPFSESFLTSLWRGYVGTWRIQKNRLYLTGVEAKIRSDPSLETIFPGFPERVFAHWYSGELRIPQGRMLQYVHAGFGSIYDADLFLRVEKGIVIGSRTHENRPSESSRRLAADEGPTEFSLRKENLGAELTVAEIEGAERIVDPLGAVPDLAFGHLNRAWLRFAAQLPPGGKLAPFSADWRPEPGLAAHLEGYVILDAGRLGPYWAAARSLSPSTSP